MNKFYKLAIKVSTIVVGFGSALTALAQVTVTPVSPPAVPETTVGFTRDNAWVQVGVYLNYAVALIGVIAVVMLLYGAYLYMSAGANEDNAKKGKNAIIYGVIGAVVAVLAFSVFSFAKSLLGLT